MGEYKSGDGQWSGSKGRFLDMECRSRTTTMAILTALRGPTFVCHFLLVGICFFRVVPPEKGTR